MSTKHQYKAHKTLASEDHYFYSRMLKFTMCGTTSTHCCIKLKFYHIRFTRCCSNRMIREYKKKTLWRPGPPWNLQVYTSASCLHFLSDRVVLSLSSVMRWDYRDSWVSDNLAQREREGGLSSVYTQ